MVLLRSGVWSPCHIGGAAAASRIRRLWNTYEPGTYCVPMRTLPRRLDATADDLDRGRDLAREIAGAVLGRDPGPLTTAASMSHYVYLGADIVVKLVDTDGHTRLDREVALASHLPPGLGARLLASGDTSAVRYACFARVPGTALVPGLPGVDAATAGRWAGQAVHLLGTLHDWKPAGDAERSLRESPVHEGFFSREAFEADIEYIAGAVPGELIDGLTAIAGRAPGQLKRDVPVHADGDWGNWLAGEPGITALLDFERARFGEPADDWILLALSSGPHLDLVLGVIAHDTGTGEKALRAACELRDAACTAQEIRATHSDERVRHLDGLVTGRRWWGGR